MSGIYDARPGPQDNKLLSLPAVVHEMGAGRRTAKGGTTSPSLKVLDVSRNGIIALSTGLGSMTMLERLVLRHNKLKNLSYIMGSLKRLKVAFPNRDLPSRMFSALHRPWLTDHFLRLLQGSRRLFQPNRLNPLRTRRDSYAGGALPPR